MLFKFKITYFPKATQLIIFFAMILSSEAIHCFSCYYCAMTRPVKEACNGDEDSCLSFVGHDIAVPNYTIAIRRCAVDIGCIYYENHPNFTVDHCTTCSEHNYCNGTGAMQEATTTVVMTIAWALLVMPAQIIR